MSYSTLHVTLLGALCTIAAAPAFAQAPRDRAPSAPPSAAARIEVGPNIRVSDDGNIPHIEPMLAVHPTNPKALVGVVSTQRETGIVVAAYASRDGGFSWSPSALPIRSAGDPQIAIGKTGTAYFAALGVGDAGRGLYVARSEDGGFTWQKPTLVAPGQDHEQILIDNSNGRFAGRLYLTSLYGPNYHLGMFRSEDDGRTWHGPVEFIDGEGKYGHNTNNLLLLSDGTLFVPYFTWTRYRPAGQRDTSYVGYVLTSDGGVTFTAPRRIRQLEVLEPHKPGDKIVPRQFPEFAVDPGSARYRDRIYMVYPALADGRARLFVQHSSDRGVTWSDAKLLDPSVPAHADQFQQMIAVNKDGTVAVTWFDTRQTPDRSGFDQYVTASVDGGETFLPPARVSSASTIPYSSGNLGLSAGVFGRGDTVYISLLGAAGRLDTGGDYMGLVADSNGVFRALWVDSRSGTYQVYTAPVRVATGEVSLASSTPSVTVRRLRGEEFELLFDATAYDERSGVVTIPLRIRNRTNKPLFGPITMRLELNPKLGDRGPMDEKYYPTILGATNGKTGPGAEFDLTATAGSTGSIAPGETTGPYMLRIKPVSRTEMVGWMMTFVSAGVPR